MEEIIKENKKENNQPNTFNSNNNNEEDNSKNKEIYIYGENNLIEYPINNSQSINSLNSLNSDNSNSNCNAILDKEKIDFYVGFLMFSLTTSVLFPYSSVLSSLDYFDEVYPNYYTASTLPFVYMFTIAITYLLVLRVHYKIKHHYNILGGFMVYVVVLLSIPFINLSSIKGTLGSYILTVLLICSTAIVDTFIQSSIMSIAASFGSHYSIFCQIGFGFSGVLSAIIRIIVKFSFDNQEDRTKKGIIIFYSISGFVIIVATIIFLVMLRSHIGKYIMKKDININKLAQNNRNNSDNGNNYNIIDNNDNISKNNLKLNQSPLKYVILKNIHYNLILISLFTITLILYPSFIYKVEFKDIRKDLYMVSITAVYSFFDFFVSFRYKSLVYVLLVIFGFSDGFLSSICVSEPPKQVEREYKELSGIVTSFAANIGLLLGSSINLLLMLSLF